MYESLRAGQIVTLDRVGTFADGVAVRRVGDETFRVASEVVDEIILVNTDEICAAIKDIFEDVRVVVEPAGALAVAGLKRYAERSAVRGQTLIAVNSGANMNFGRLRHVTERAEIGEHREALLAVEIPERPGAFLTVLRGARRPQHHGVQLPLRAGREGADLRRRVAATRRGRSRRARGAARGAGLPRARLERQRAREAAHPPPRRRPSAGLKDELLYRFEFPERPGALLAFLQAIGDLWNISLFHYRNHGSDYGRVLAGVQVPEAGPRASSRRISRSSATRCWDETANPAYRLFLKAP